MATATEQIDGAEPTPRAPALGWRLLLSIGRLAGIAALLITFVRSFNHEINQPLVDGFWVLALLLWASEVKAHSTRPFVGVRIKWADARLILGILVVFAAAWLPFYDNW